MISGTAMVSASDVSFTSAMTKLVKGGSISTSACGSTIRRITGAGRMPRLTAASTWPRSTDWIPARNTSAR